MAEGMKSFSASVKEELLAVTGEGACCDAAEASAVIRFLRGKETQGENVLCTTENEGLARKVFTLLKKAFNINLVFSEDLRSRRNRKLFSVKTGKSGTAIPEGALSKRCCMRAYIRGAYLAAGTMSDPARAYRLEVICPEEEDAGALQDILRKLGLSPKQFCRRGKQVVYFQDGEQISTFLGLAGAYRSVLTMENVRVLRSTRGSVARRVNCETSNLEKTVYASARQLKDILYIEEKGIMDGLPDALKKTAELRKLYPEASNAELGAYAEPPVGRSGISHRLRKLSEIAAEARSKERDFHPKEEKE